MGERREITRGDVQNHLKGLKSDVSRLKYLDRLFWENRKREKKSDLLTRDARTFVREEEDRLYSKIGKLGEMGEIGVTKEYLKTVGNVYKEKGLFAAAGYEINSTLYSLANRIHHFFSTLAVGADEMMHTGAPEPMRVFEPQAYYAREEVRGRPNYIKSRRKSFILRGKKDNNLETAAVATSILAFVGGIFFLSPNLTGNAIGNMTNSTTNIIGVVLFTIGIVGAFFYFRRR
ncbi:MAG: DUF308 domain-containing protein [Candidatus Nanoarchaeia archaeon]|nr:DUF308 domain-containing protein [Candidatus Nanoarchaeia archaeon]MDD5740385.1 DUF308 domain-containing protein [Candidatus Nanoarchaeia archaeon]